MPGGGRTHVDETGNVTMSGRTGSRGGGQRSTMVNESGNVRYGGRSSQQPTFRQEQEEPSRTRQFEQEEPLPTQQQQGQEGIGSSGGGRRQGVSETPGQQQQQEGIGSSGGGRRQGISETPGQQQQQQQQEQTSRGGMGQRGQQYGEQQHGEQSGRVEEYFGKVEAINPSETRVCVTGANSFLGSHIVAQLLHKGYIVRGTVRDPTDVSKTQHLTSMPGALERLELTKADLLESGSFDSAVEGCQFVIHTACPYKLDAEDPQKDLLEPAREGTLNVLRSCSKVAGLRRVVMTSAMAAITDSPKEGHTYTEKDWNSTSTLSKNPFHYAKVEAERAAWEHIRGRGTYQGRRQQKGQGRQIDTESDITTNYEQISSNDIDKYDLVVMNPFFIIGPSFVNRLNASMNVLRDLVTGKFRGVADITWAMVDVRDVATAHIRAIEVPHAHGRYILCNPQPRRMRQLVNFLRDELKLTGKGYRLPHVRMDGRMGSFFIKYLVGYMQPTGVRNFLKSHIGRTIALSTSKCEREFGMSWTEMDQSLRDSFADMVRWRHLPQPETPLSGKQASDMYWGRSPLHAPVSPQVPESEEGQGGQGGLQQQQEGHGTHEEARQMARSRKQRESVTSRQQQPQELHQQQPQEFQQQQLQPQEFQQQPQQQQPRTEAAY